MTEACDRSTCDKWGHHLKEESSFGVEVKHVESGHSLQQKAIERLPHIWLPKATLLEKALVEETAQVVTYWKILELLVQSYFLKRTP